MQIMEESKIPEIIIISLLGIAIITMIAAVRFLEETIRVGIAEFRCKMNRNHQEVAYCLADIVSQSQEKGGSIPFNPDGEKKLKAYVPSKDPDKIMEGIENEVLFD